MKNANARALSDNAQREHEDESEGFAHPDYNVADCWLCVEATTDNHYMGMTGDEVNHTDPNPRMCLTCADDADELLN
mgnify:FL=1